MKIGYTLYVTDRASWRSWLKENHKTKSEIWLIYYKKSSKKPRISYNHAVEEALCFGWIDSTCKTVDEERFAQRFTPRKKNSNLSMMNLERIKRLIKAKKMTKVGLDSVARQMEEYANKTSSDGVIKIPADIRKELKKDPQVWENFSKFPPSYKNIRIDWIDNAREVPEVFEKRLKHFLKMTAKNKKYGMVQ